MDISVNTAKKLDRTHILVVDDDPVLLNLMVDVIEHLGYIVTVATGSNEAIGLMKNFIFDLVIADYFMSGLNGVELATKAKKFLVKTPIILYSGNINSIDGNQLAAAGIAEVLSKPCDIRELEITIKRILGGKKKASF